MKIGSFLNFKITLISLASNFRFSKFSSVEKYFILKGRKFNIFFVEFQRSLRKTVCQNVTFCKRACRVENPVLCQRQKLFVRK